jgi:hypothetical protein
VKLAVYDILGREIAVLVDEQQTAGSYRVQWDGRRFPSGVYFGRIAAGEFREARRMLLVR